MAWQAFHWFDPRLARKEFARILCPAGWVAVVWNERRIETSATLRAYEDMLRKYSPDYAQVAAQYPEPEPMKRFFGAGELRQREFSNEQIFDFDGLRGRLLRSSYLLPKGYPNHELMLGELRRIFDAHDQDGRVRIEYTTHLYCGRL